MTARADVGNTLIGTVVELEADAELVGTPVAKFVVLSVAETCVLSVEVELVKLGADKDVLVVTLLAKVDETDAELDNVIEGV